jgi:hypothetical protein
MAPGAGIPPLRELEDLFVEQRAEQVLDAGHALPQER